jgi:hypothetical protein
LSSSFDSSLIQKQDEKRHQNFLALSLNWAGGPYIKSTDSSGAPIHAVSSHEWAFERSSNPPPTHIKFT